MEQISISSTQERHQFVCPITLDVYRDPVFAGDGHVYERAAIVQWIEQQGTSPFTRQPLNIDDLHPAEIIKEVCQSYQSNPVTYSMRTNETPLSSLLTFESNTDDERRTVRKQHCNAKRILVITLASTFIISSIVIITLFVFYYHGLNLSTSSDPIHTKNPRNRTYPPTTYNLPNICTLPKIVQLFSWDNVASFNFTFYSEPYQAVSNKTIITFAFRNDPSFWCLDNVSVIDTSSKVELLTNGHFEDNPSDGFIRCNTRGDTATTSFMPPPYSFTVQRTYCSGSVGLPDYLSQTLNTTIGQMYQISFWLQNKGRAPNGAQVMMSY